METSIRWMVETRDSAKAFLHTFIENNGDAPKILLDQIQNRNFTTQLAMLIHYLNQEIEKRGKGQFR